ncbi:calpastatin isoform X3 [Electrophorus electricus]|uniref:calpastatin isoform X3 n=1 Tax=Electrophorus electricus TaxID=8005 RepID=UPI0015D07000|nr:calpastatin isoform X3 [Electrophorus electricus]
MGQIFSWFRGTQDTPSLQDVAVEHQSDPKQHKPTPAVPVSTVKPTEHEKGAASSSSKGMSAKPGTPAAGASVPPTLAPTGNVPVATIGAGLSAGASSGSPATGGRPTVAAGSTGTQSGSSKVTPQAPYASPAKAPQASATIGATGGLGAAGWAGKPSTSPVKPKDTSKDKAQSAAILSSKPEPPKVMSTGAAKPFAASSVSISAAQKDGAKSKEAKVCTQGPTAAAKTSAPVSDDDPFDALADSLPSSDPLAPTAPQYTGPEVMEHDITSEVANRCGDREDTLPPGYRREDMEKKIPARVPDKPAEQPKPLTTDDALDALSAGFGSSGAQRTAKPAMKDDNVDAVNVRAIHAPTPPQKKIEVSAPASKSPAAPADKKAKVEMASPLKPDKVPTQGPTVAAKTSAPEKKIPARVPDKLAEQPKLAQSTMTAAPPSSQAVQSKTGEGDPMSLDALEALGDLLPDSQPAPETPPPRPGDIVDERTLDSEKGVRVGEREDSIPPEYRFSKEDAKKYPPPPKEPSLDPVEALDILSSDFASPAAAPLVQASVHSFAPPKQVACGIPSAHAQVAKSTVESTSEVDPMSLDALSALGDMLPVAQPTPESPKLRPEDIVDEKKLASEKAMRVGEREDTLPPDYRFSKGDVQKQPAPPRKEPSLDPEDALNILSGDFSGPTKACAVHASLPPSAPPADSSADFGLEQLAGDLVAPLAVHKVQSAPLAHPKADRQLSDSTASAMDALGDTLMDMGVAPEPTPVSPRDIVMEKEAVEERVSKPGERDDSLPPDYRPTEADIKAAAEAKAKAKAKGPAAKTSMDESAALDVLSSDFSAPSVAPPAAPVVSPACPPHGTAAKTPPTQTASGRVLGSQTTTHPEAKPKDSKPKTKGGKSKSKPKKPAGATISASDDVSGKMSTDVASKKGGKH